MFAFLKTDSIKLARKDAPWATKFRKHSDGYMAFLDNETFKEWKNKYHVFYRLELINESEQEEVK